jgi:hypothetical protein
MDSCLHGFFCSSPSFPPLFFRYMCMYTCEQHVHSCTHAYMCVHVRINIRILYTYTSTMKIHVLCTFTSTNIREDTRIVYIHINKHTRDVFTPTMNIRVQYCIHAHEQIRIHSHNIVYIHIDKYAPNASTKRHQRVSMCAYVLASCAHTYIPLKSTLL